jgi:hypothetical protein
MAGILISLVVVDVSFSDVRHFAALSGHSIPFALDQQQERPLRWRRRGRHLVERDRVAADAAAAG